MILLKEFGLADPHDAPLAWLIGIPFVAVLAVGVLFLAWALIAEMLYHLRAPSR